MVNGDSKALHELQCHLDVRNGDELVDDLDLHVPQSQWGRHEERGQVLAADGSGELDLQDKGEEE